MIITDPDGHPTTLSYADNFTNDYGSPSGNTNTYLTAVTRPSTNGAVHSSRFQYGFNDGKLRSSVGENSHVTTFCYRIGGCSGSSFDPWLRLTQVVDASGGGATTSYSDSGPSPSFTTTTAASPDPNIVTKTVLDGVGHTIENQLFTNSGIISTVSSYDGFGRVSRASNPYQSSTETTYGWTSYNYDALGRKLLQCNPDNGSNIPCVAGSSYLQWSYNGNVTTSYDEARNPWQRTSDALGRLTNVTEPTGASTGYVYDALNNLRTVNQNGVSGEVPRTRGFIYDSLSRLNSATNPETGNVGYIYDANGNVISKTDARGIAINYGYDVLNRLIAKTSSDGSIHYEYFYDGDTLIDPNAKGHLVHASNDINGANDFYYDPMGRVIRQTFCIPSDCSYSQQISTTYDLAGHVTSLTYPDRRGITQGYDLAGRLQSVSMTAVPISGAASSSPFITSISYFANGSPQSIIYGNGITEQLAQNSRLQTCESNAFLSPSLGGQIIMNHQYFFSSTTGSPCSDTPGNNGNIWGIVDATNVGQGSGQRSQGFTYDSLNRVRTWNTNLMAGGPRSQTFNYDSFGNLTQTSGINMPNYDPIAPFINNRLPASSFGCSPSSNAYAIDPANLGYDLAGNVLCSGAQGYNAQAYIYDAENQITQTQKQIMNNTYNAAASYTYNALGDRIRKDQGGYGSQQYTEYIWSNGRVLAEKNQNGIWTDYIYANGKKIVSAKTSIVRSHLSGTNSTGGDAYRLDTGVLPIPANYTVKAGDVLGFRMWVRNANAGLSMGFTDTTDTSTLCVPDNHGDCFNQESTSDQWVNRVINLGAFVANRTIGVLRMSNYQGPAGRFDIMVMDMAITSSDGTVTQIIGGEPTGSCPTVGSGVPTPDLTCVSEEVTDPSDFAGQPSKTMYFLSDLLGTSQLELSKGGWPVWKGEFSPFGQELDNQITPDRYRFTGKERDAESGLDYFGARYYTSSMGRWMSPDWADKPEAVPYSKLDNPQSLNLYGYVLNNPLSQKDDDGHEIIYSDNLKNSQLVRDTVTATLANPNTSSYLSGYVGKDAPNLMIQSGDLGPPTVTILPNGQTLTTTVQGNTAPDIQTTQMNNDPPQTTLTGATITIDNNTSKGDTPGVMIHESVHAGEAQQNPAQFGKDAKAERGQPHDSRPQEQRANAVRHANEKDINKAVKQIEKYRKKELQ